MGRLHIFNPDSEYALANGSQWFTPPASVVNVRRSLALVPAVYATPGEDVILLLDTPALPLQDLAYHDLAVAKRLGIVTKAELDKPNYGFGKLRVEPWGWNMAMRRFVINHIGLTPGLPSEEEMVRLRELSHRRLTISFLEHVKLHSDAIEPEIEIPVEIRDPELAMKAYTSDRHRYFKTPWSSSGRGIMLTDDMEPQHVEPWVRGVIERQGSVMMEKAYKRRLDFASEWICKSGKAEFIGWSVFETSRRGKYHGQVKGSQSELIKLIDNTTHCNLHEIIEAQKDALETLVAGGYNGPAGIDMLVTDSGAVNPCVELNLRHTMGMIDLLEDKRIQTSTLSKSMPVNCIAN